MQRTSGEFVGRLSVSRGSLRKRQSPVSASLYAFDLCFLPRKLRRVVVESIDQRRSDQNVLDDPATKESAAASGVNELDTVEFDNPPWDTWTAWKLTVQVLCLTIPLSQGGVPLVGQLVGSSVDQMSAAEIAWAADFMEVVQLCGVTVLLWAGTREWPSSQQWLKYDITPKAVAQGIGTALTAFGGAFLLAFLSSVVWVGTPGDAETPIGQALLETSDISATVGASVLAIVLAPVLEELIYRGFLLPSLLRRFEPPAAVAITSALFAVSHCNPKLSVGFFVAGCAYGGGYVLSGGNLAVATLGHALYNSAVVIQSITV